MLRQFSQAELDSLCGGTLAVELRCLMGPAWRHHLVGYMGSKRRWAGRIAAVLGFADASPRRVRVVDAGPWGDVWRTIANDRTRRDLIRLAQQRAWQAASAETDLRHAWKAAAERPPPQDPAARALQYLILQARVASSVPVWWDGERWASPSGARRSAGTCNIAGSRRLGAAGQRDSQKANEGRPGDRHTSRGLTRWSTLVARLRMLEHVPWDRVEVVHGDLRDVAPIPGARVFFDPPYLGAPRYAALLGRADVLAVARRHAAVAERVVVCEAEPLPLEGWDHARLPHKKPEWLTTYGCTAPTAAEQLTLEAV